MAIESAAFFRRLARTGLLVTFGAASLCGVAMGQKELVTSGTVIPITINIQGTPCQIYKIINAPNGDTLFMDVCGGGGYGAIYRMKSGSTNFDTITSTIDSAGTYWNEDMTMDAKGTLYIPDRYGSQHLYRVPYNPSDGKWDFSASGDSFEPTLASGFDNNGTQNVAFLDSAARDGSGILFVSSQSSNDIMMIPVNADGTVPNFPSGPDAGQPQFQYLITKLEDKVQPMVVDTNGNLYFIENPYDSPTARATGVFFVPQSAYKACMAASASGSTDPRTPCISGAETSLERIDPGNTEKFNGLTLDAAGNVYVGDAADSYGGTRNGILMIPNESGSPKGVTAASFNIDDAEYISSAPVNANPTIDPRGFIWIPTGSSGNWSPNGSGPLPGTGNLILWAPGTANLGATPVGTPGAAGIVFYTFSGGVTPSSIGFSQPGGGTDFSAVTTNPDPPTGGATSAIPCTAGTAYIAYSACQYWVALTPQGANSVGNVAGELSMLDSSNKVIPGSTSYLHGIGEGPAVSLLSPAMQTPLATALVSPKQVAGDSLGDSFVADAGQVLEFGPSAPGATPTAGLSIGTGLTAPTGVAVDNAGDLYIADSGKVIEIPAVNGTLNAAGQTVLQTGLGSNLRLAVDGADNVYVADPDNARVVKIYNSQMAMYIPGLATVGSGFTKPSAVAVDDANNVYVADGTNLVEVNVWGGETTISNSLSAPVTGIAVDPSGSVYVAQSGGVLRIPMESTGLSSNDATTIANEITAPTGLGIDALGNLYVTADSYDVSTLGSGGAGTSTVSTPNVLLVNGAFVNFGLVSQQTQTAPVDVNVYNIGNAALAFTADPTFGGANAADYSISQDGLNPCDTSGATPVAGGTACQLGVAATAVGLGISQGTMTVATNAVNAPTTGASLEAYSSNLLCRTLTTITVTPSTGVIYPGSTSVSSTTIPDPANPCTQGGAPQGGNIVLTLAPQAKGSSQITQSQVLSGNGQATFDLTALKGGTYLLYVAYRGDAVYGGSSSSRTYSFVVGQAAPTVTLAEPTGITPVNGVYYVYVGSTTTMATSVTSTLGSPTGSVQFLNNGSAPADSTQNPVALDASGNATFNTANLPGYGSPSNPSGIYNLTAVYGSDTNFATVTSPVVTIQVIPQIALITASPGAITTKAGIPVTTTLNITALEGYSPLHGAQLYCDSATLPQYSECTFNVPTLDIADAYKGLPLGAMPTVTSNVTISSNVPVNVGKLETGTSPITFAGIFGLGLLGLAFRRKAKFNRSLLSAACLMLIFAGALVGFSGCTNSGYTHTPAAPHVTTPSGTYNVSVYTIDLTSNLRSSLPFTFTVTVQ